MEIYDLIVLGGGPAGYNAAAYACENGLKVLLFEQEELGGVCLNEGCVPSKTLLNSAKIFNYIKHSENYGVITPDKGCISQPDVIVRKDKVVKRLVTGVKAKLKNAGVEVLKSRAEIINKTDKSITVLSEGNEYNCKNVLIATGSHAFIPPINGIDEGLEKGIVITNHEVLNLTVIPNKLIIVGGGVIGLEMADYYGSVGSEVTVIEAMPKIAAATGEKITSVLQRALEKKNIKIILNSKVIEINGNNVVIEKNEGRELLFADKILVSVGRRPSIQNIGLENIGVKTNRGCIVTDDMLRTNVKGVYAAGDVNGKSMLAHTAYREGEVAINTILGKDDKMNYQSIPSVIYTSPEVASVGISEQEAISRGVSAQTVSISLMYSGRYVAENTDYTGICQLTYDKENRTLIGAEIIGSYASEYIVAVSNLIDLEIPVERIKKLVFPHPTVCEVIREAVFEI